MTEECKEEKCLKFRVLEHNDKSSALFNMRAREAVEKGKDLDGAAGSLCGACMTLKRNRAALEKGQLEFLASK